MSDLHDEMNQGAGAEEAQPTRKMPAVSEEPMPRRRRAERMAGRVPFEEKAPRIPAEREVRKVPFAPDEMPTPENVEELLNAATSAPEHPEGPNAPRQEVREEASPRQEVPRPNALNRAAKKRAAMEQGQEQLRGGAKPRQAVSAPGYDRRQPLGQGGEGGSVRFAAGERERAEGGMSRPEEPRIAPQPVAENFTEVPEAPKKHRALVIAVIVVLVLALMVLGLMMVPADNPGFLGSIRRAITGEPVPDTNQSKETTVLDFTGAPTQGAAPLDITFTLTTSKDVTDVRLVNEAGEDVGALALRMMDNADTSVWMMSLHQTEAYAGGVFLQVSTDDEAWLDTGRSLPLTVTGDTSTTVPEPTLFAAEETETPTERPTLAPTSAPTLEPTIEPTAEPTAEPMIEATLEPTLEPTEAPAATPEITQPATQAPVITATPEPETPTEEPTIEPTPTMMVSPTPAVGGSEPETTDAPVEAVNEPVEPTEVPRLIAQADESALPDLIANSTIYSTAARKLDSYSRELADRINMPDADSYLRADFGVLTFRGSSFRQNAASGTVGDLSQMSVLWQMEAGSVKGSSSTYYGFGWTNQPAIVKWSKEVRALSNITDEKKNTTALKEVIIGGLDGKIYFVDLADGQPTRDAINLGYPMKGSPSIHPYSFPVMSIGQYARKMASGTGSIGMRVYNLLTQKQAFMLDGLDKDAGNRAYYEVGAFDTASLFDGAADTMVSLGTNGMLYLTKLNTEFDFNKGTIKVDPASVTMTSRTKGQRDKYTAVESSLAMYQQYVWYADMEGILRCIDTDSLTTVWAVDVGDAVEAAIALDLDAEGNLWLYVADELNLRNKGDSGIQCYNALTGAKRWQTDIPLKKSERYTAGVKASPVVGQNGLSGLVYYAVSGAAVNDLGEQDGVLLALNKETGAIAWAQPLSGYAYSSPVAVYTEEGRGYVIQADASGMLYLLDGLTGEKLNTLQLEGTIEASPAVYGSTLVIGTTGRNTSYLYGISLE